MAINDYTNRKKRLLRELDRALFPVRDTLIAWYGESEAEAIISESRRKYAELIPQIPFIGARNPLLLFLLPTGRYLAIYRAFQNHGKTLEEMGYLVNKIAEAEFRAIPGWVRHMIGQLWFSRWFIRRIQRRAEESQRRQYPGGYILTYVDGAGQDFTYGIDYLECASCKFLNQQGAAELAPCVCAVDQLASEMLGWGLRRTMTLAEGGDKCDFRFKKGGRTSVSLPVPIK